MISMIRRCLHWKECSNPHPIEIAMGLKMKTILSLFALLVLSAVIIRAENKPQLAELDRVRLAEAFRLADTLGNRVWPDWSKAPFAVLLVTEEYEFLIRNPHPAADFTLINYDPWFRSKVYYRKRTQSTHLLATFPLDGPVPTIVIGQAENTAKKTSTPWVVILMHEHFHQLQYSQPSYYPDANALGLASHDKTGMWMLNYPFPYDWAEMHELFTHLGQLLSDALEAKTSADFATKLAAYRKQRVELENTLSPDDYRYVSFQLWQEGIARYTEFRIATLAAKSYKPSKAFRALKDYQRFSDVATETRRGILNELRTNKIEESKREIFYALGAGEGLLLDRVNPRWQRSYFREKFYLNKYSE
jgi:hypothetical protein